MTILNIQQLRSRYLAVSVVSSERTRCFAKQMAECRFRPRKTREEEKCNVLKVNQSEPKHEVATIQRELKFIKRMAFSVLGSLRTVRYIQR